MAKRDYDLAIIGAGSGGLVAADFAARLGVRVALVEADKIGGDCTWTGCVPSKALVKIARVAHLIRTADRFGIVASEPQIDMAHVRRSIAAAVEKVYRRESPQELARRGIDVVEGRAAFTDPHAIDVGGRTVTADKFLVATGALPLIPPIDGLDDVPYLTHRTIFDNDKLPQHLVVIGGGPIGAEISQAYRRLGARVTLIEPILLPREDEETRQAILRVFVREDVDCHLGLATAVRREGEEIVVATDGEEELRGDMLFVAAGRLPNVAGLNLEAAGVTYARDGIPVDRRMRTNVSHIYAAGDVAGGPQFTHFAGWQGFQAARAALLPGGGAATDHVPRVTFTDPEIAHVGPDLDEARKLYGDGVETRRIEIANTDRAAAEHEVDGFIRLTVRPGGTIVAATVVAPHAGETLGELVLAIGNRVTATALAETLHAYPTYATGLQQLAVDLALERSLSGWQGWIARWIAGGRAAPAPPNNAPALPSRDSE